MTMMQVDDGSDGGGGDDAGDDDCDDDDDGYVGFVLCSRRRWRLSRRLCRRGSGGTATELPIIIVHN